MSERRTLLVVGGLGVGLLAVAWLASRQGATIAPNAGGEALSLPSGAASAPSYQPATFTVPPLISNFTGPPNPGSQVLFSFSPPANSNVQGYKVGTAQLPAPTSADGGVSGTCNCPGGAAPSYGADYFLAAALGPLVQRLANEIPTGVGPGVGGPGPDELKRGLAAMEQQKAWLSQSFDYMGV